MTNDDWVLAIDFGTSYTVAASRASGRPAEVIEIDGERRVPSVIVVDDADRIIVGKTAENLAPASPGRVLRTPKARLGEPAPVVLGNRPYTVVSLVGELLRYVYDEAVRYHDRPPTEVRLTHPATWSGPRRRQLVASAESAGIAAPILVPEPVAAAITYAEEASLESGAHVLVYDLGGGTFDTAALVSTDSGFDVVGRPGGDPRLGGELFDELLADAIGRQLDPAVYERIQLAEDVLWAQAASGLRREARRVKEALSSHPHADLLLGLPTGLVQQRIERSQLNDVISPYIDESVEVMAQTAAGAGLRSDLDSIYLVGGASRTPLVADAVREAFPDVGVSLRGDPKAAVALGATHPSAAAHDTQDRPSFDPVPTLDDDATPPAPAGPPTAPPPPPVSPAATPVATTRLPPPAPPGDDTAAVADLPSRRGVLVAIAAGAAGLLTIGAVLVTRDDGAGDTASTTTASREVIVSSTSPPNTLERGDPTTSVPETSAPDTTVPDDTDTTTSAPFVDDGVRPTAEEMQAALITPDLFADDWDVAELDEIPAVCAPRTSEGLLREELTLIQRVDEQIIARQLIHRIETYDTVENATLAFDAFIADLVDCADPIYEVVADGEVITDDLVYDVAYSNAARLDVTTDPVGCSDEAGVTTVELRDPDGPFPELNQQSEIIRCGPNVSVFMHIASADVQAFDLGDFQTGLIATLTSLSRLPGST